MYGAARMGRNLFANLPNYLIGAINHLGDIAGNVTDVTGAAIPGARILVKSRETGVSQMLATNGTGAYRASLLKPGNYTVSVTAPGFQTTSTQLTVEVGQITPGNFSLSVGSNSVTVEVNGETPLLNTESAELATTFSSEQVQALPNPETT